MSKTSREEELVNFITHGVGAVLAVAGMVLLIVFACIYGTVWHIVGFTIFGSTLTILYLSSTLYHGFRGEQIKKLFRKFDHISIFLLIAGTYTPFCFSALHGWVGWTIFGVVWGCCLLGIVLKAFFTGKMEKLSLIIYITMGWLIVFAIKPLYENISSTAFTFLLLGGLCYTLGTYFYANDKKRFHHGVWHVFVLCGSACHFFSVMSLL
jgi:hemolysin III